MENTSLRILMFLVSEIDETKNPFTVAKEIMQSLKNNLITSDQFDLLIGDLEMNCKRLCISTSNEICSLF